MLAEASNNSRQLNQNNHMRLRAKELDTFTFNLITSNTLTVVKLSLLHQRDNLHSSKMLKAEVNNHRTLHEEVLNYTLIITYRHAFSCQSRC